MITKKIALTKIIINHLTIDLENHKIEYFIGNNIKRTLVVDPTISVAKNIIENENLLILEKIENADKDIYWYKGVINLIISDDSYGQRAWFSDLN